MVGMQRLFGKCYGVAKPNAFETFELPIVGHQHGDGENNEKRRDSKKCGAVLGFGNRFVCERLQKRWVSLCPSNVVCR